MLYDLHCESCGKESLLKSCPIKNILVCSYCCLTCSARSRCEARVWFKSLEPNPSIKKPKREISLDDFLR